MKSHNKSNNDAKAAAGKVVRPGNEPASTTVSQVTRLEVIDETGRRLVRYLDCAIELSFQDRNRTLKIFVGKK